MKHPLSALFLALATLGSAAEATKPIDIRLATIMPEGTSGHQRMLELRDAWSKASSKRVRLSVISAPQDGEQRIVSHMRSGTFNAALMSAVGLADIDRSVTCLQLIPMQFRDWAEVDYVREKIRGDLEKRLAAKGFVVLFWADAGWVRYFSKEPAVRPADFKPMKMFVWSGEPHQLNILRTLGYQPVGLETDGIPAALQTNMISVVPVPPFLANALQFTKWIHHMVDLNWVPIIGAAIVRREVWEKVPADLRPELLKTAEDIGARIRVRGREEDLESITAMKNRGLTVHAATPEIAAEWKAIAEKAYPHIRGKLVPADLFDRVQAELVEYRAAKGKTTP